MPDPIREAGAATQATTAGRVVDARSIDPDTIPPGVAEIRWAIAADGGWPWCTEHHRARWHDVLTCAPLHPAESADDRGWCPTHERLHEPMEWASSCEPIDTTDPNGAP